MYYIHGSNEQFLHFLASNRMVFTGTLNDANDYIEKRRPIPPALYNVRRVKEKPTPLLEPNGQHNNELVLPRNSTVHVSSPDRATSPQFQNDPLFVQENGIDDVSSQSHSVSPLINNFDEEDDSDTYYNYENIDNNSLAAHSSIVTPTSNNNNLLSRNTSENQVVPLQNVTSNNNNLLSRNSSENQVITSQNIARFHLNESGQREFLGACFQWMQQQMNSTRNPLFSNGRSIRSTVTQRAIAGQPIEQGNTENVLCLLLYCISR